MKILFDHNISVRILSQLNSFPDAQYVKNVGLTDEEDRSIWDYAIRISDYLKIPHKRSISPIN